MDKNFFNKVRILDGGMGQELLARGMEPNGTLWSANALLQEKYHQLLLDTHLAFVKAGAEIIVVGNSESFDVQESKVVYRDLMVAEEAEVLGAQLGFPVEFNELISPATEVTVVIGADFVTALS